MTDGPIQVTNLLKNEVFKDTLHIQAENVS